MGLPRHLGSADSGSGRGPFGEKAFRAALVGCVVLVVIGPVLLLLGGAAGTSVGASFLVLGVLGLLTGAGGLLLERALQRRPPPQQDVISGNGRDGNLPHPSRVQRINRP